MSTIEPGGVRNLRTDRHGASFRSRLTTILVVATVPIAIAGPALAAGSPPTAPSIVSLATGPSTATVTWRAPASDGGSPITVYVATATPTISTEAAHSCTTMGTTTCTISGLTPGSIYWVSVTAGNPTLGPASVPVADSPIGNAPPVMNNLPAITEVAPFEATKKGGTRITIRGTNLLGATKVTFNGVKGTDLVLESPTKIKVTAPKSKAGPAVIKVTTPKGQLTSMGFVFD